MTEQVSINASTRREITDAERVREHILDEAVRAGKFPASRKDHYRRMYNNNPVAAKAAIGMLAAVLPGGTEVDAEDSSYPREWLSASEQRAQPAQPPSLQPAGPKNGYPREWLGPDAPAEPEPKPKPKADSANSAYPSEWLNASEQPDNHRETNPVTVAQD